MAENETARPGASFEAQAVVDSYRFRAPYPAELYRRLIALAPRRHRLLDLGCGPGKIARPLSRHFTQVVAVDPSSGMLGLAKSLEDGRAPNIRWIAALAEEAEIGPEPFDLVVAANSIHWMDHKRLFPMLSLRVAQDHRIAIVSGDDAHLPPWNADWTAFLSKWVPISSGQPFDPVGKAREWSAYQAYLDIEGSEVLVSEPFEQSVEDFIRCQHSRKHLRPVAPGRKTG
jgi:SAM-dependent methyltransferase